MKGIPADLDLATLHGAEVVQVCLGLWQVQLCFHTGVSISIECDWELVDENNRLIDCSSDTVREQPFQLHLLLSRVVVATEVSSPLSFSLGFTGGLRFRVLVRDDGNESFSIQPLGIIV
jgi:hypothetical protein